MKYDENLAIFKVEIHGTLAKAICQNTSVVGSKLTEAQTSAN